MHFSQKYEKAIFLIAVSHFAFAVDPVTGTFKNGEWRRDLQHVNLESSSLYGNSTDLEYFYTQVYVGSHRQPQTLIVDTGSSIAAMPC